MPGLDDATRARALGDELVRIHGHLRQQLAALLSDFPDEPADLSEQLRERCLSACDVLQAHHANESTRGFPLLHRRFPDLAPVLEQLGREHDALAELRRQVLDLLDAGGDAVRVQGELRRLAAEMEAHFDREEQQLLPALNGL
jgi:iron-sulfur cluster repair protein YtfE (RIC family)